MQTQPQSITFENVLNMAKQLSRVDQFRLLEWLMSQIKQLFITSDEELAPPIERMSIAEMRLAARQQAKPLPRAELVARFQKVTADIRQEAMANGTAIEGDWLDD